MFPIRDVVVFAVLSGLLTAVLLYFWSWTRTGGVFALAGVGTTIGFAAWYLVLNATGAGANFDVDAPVVRVSWADAGSGVFSFLVTALLLGLVFRRGDRAGRVVGAAAIAGLVAMILDIFVL